MDESDKDHEARPSPALKVLQSRDAPDVLLCVAANASSKANSTVRMNVSDIQIRMSRQVRVNLQSAVLGINVARVQFTVSSQLRGDFDSNRGAASHPELSIWLVTIIQLPAIGTTSIAIGFDVFVGLANTGCRQGDWFSHVL